MADGLGSVSLRDFFDARFEPIEAALGRVEKKLDQLAALNTRVTVLESRVKLLCGIGTAVGLVVIGLAVESLWGLLV